MIYMDNAATSFPKPERVYEEMERCMREYCANPGRGGHQMSIMAGKAVLETREAICRIFNISNPMQVCLTKNATEAINYGIRGLLKAGDHVITTCMEHNSVMRPLKTLEKEAGVEVTILRGDPYGQVDPYDLKKHVKANTALIVTTLSSNVNGAIMPVREMGRIASEEGVRFLVDASQGAGAMALDVRDMNIDALAFPGHKGLLGPQGTGGLYVKEEIKLKPLLQGGTGSSSENLLQPEFMPDILESGTLNTPGIVGLRYGIEFLEGIGIENVSQYKGFLLKKLIDGLEDINGIKGYSLRDTAKNSGIAAINIEGIDSNEVSHRLDREYSIATRAGLHCAPMAHKTLGTLAGGVVRFSLGCFNTAEEVETVVNAVADIAAGQKHGKVLH